MWKRVADTLRKARGVQAGTSPPAVSRSVSFYPQALDLSKQSPGVGCPNCRDFVLAGLPSEELPTDPKGAFLFACAACGSLWVVGNIASVVSLEAAEQRFGVAGVAAARAASPSPFPRRQFVLPEVPLPERPPHPPTWEQQAEWIIALSQRDIRLAEAALPQHEANNDPSGVYRSYRELISSNARVGLVRWRGGQNPSVEFGRAVDWGDAAMHAMARWNATSVEIDNVDWIYVASLAQLMDREFDPPPNAQSANKLPAVALCSNLLRAVKGQPLDVELDTLFDQLARNSRNAIIIETYRTYFRLLASTATGEEVEPLVRIAEANFRWRARNERYSGYSDHLGGGPDNPYSVDWQLASVLKKISWSGDGLHRWHWSA